MYFGVTTPLVSAADATSLVGSITDNLVANLPFVLAVVGFGIVFGIVMHFVKRPVKH